MKYIAFLLLVIYLLLKVVYLEYQTAYLEDQVLTNKICILKLAQK